LPLMVPTSALSFFMPGLADMFRARMIQHQFGVVAHARVSGLNDGKLLDEEFRFQERFCLTLGRETSGSRTSSIKRPRVS